MNKYLVRSCLIRDKDIFLDLYHNSPLQNKQRLQSASKGEIKTIFYVLYHLVSGNIPIDKHAFEKVKKAKKLRKLRHFFENKKVVEDNLKKELIDQIAILQNFANIFGFLFHPLFNLK